MCFCQGLCHQMHINYGKSDWFQKADSDYPPINDYLARN